MSSLCKCNLNNHFMLAWVKSGGMRKGQTQGYEIEIHWICAKKNFSSLTQIVMRLKLASCILFCGSATLQKCHKLSTMLALKNSF